MTAMSVWTASAIAPSAVDGDDREAAVSPPSSPTRSQRTPSGGGITSVPSSPLSRRPSSAGSLTSLETPPLLRRPSDVHGFTTACTDLNLLAAWVEQTQPPPPPAHAGPGQGGGADTNDYGDGDGGGSDSSGSGSSGRDSSSSSGRQGMDVDPPKSTSAVPPVNTATTQAATVTAGVAAGRGQGPLAVVRSWLR